jgi:hypothetical protein
MMQALLPFLAFLFVLSFPSTNLQFFDGLPFSALPEFAVLALAAPFLLFPELRVRQAEFWRQWKIRPAYLWLVLAAVLLIKGILFASGEYAGFAGCYRSQAEPTGITHEDLPFRECERSYENLFGRFPATRMDETIWFGQDNWNLVFLNTNRYNYYEWEAGNILRSRMPIEVRWIGYPDTPSGGSIRIEYAGEGKVVWGDVRAVLPPSYEATSVVEIHPPSVESPLEVDFSFDDGSRSGLGAEDWGPGASIKISAVENGVAVSLAARSPKAWRILALFADGMILLWIAACLPALWQSLRRDLIGLMMFAAGVGLFGFMPAAPVFRAIGISAMLAAILVAHLIGRPFRGISQYFIAVAAGFAILYVWASGAGSVLLRSAGNDPLTYESQAYSILATGSLRGGESVFWAIPAYRYIKFLEHALFGDGDMLFAAVLLAAYFGGVFWVFRGWQSRAVPVWHRVLPVGLGCALILFGGYYVSGVIRQGLSEYGAWILLLWAIPGMFGAPGGAGILAGAAALATVYTIRPNLIPGVLWIFMLTAIGSWKKRANTVLLAGILALGIALLPLVHNVVFGGQWVPSTNSGGTPANLVVPPSAWLASLRGDGAAAMAIREQMDSLILLTDVPRSLLPTLAAMGLFLVGWMAASGIAVVHRKTYHLAWLALPPVMLSVHLFYDAVTYYPRHIVAAYLCMAVTAVLTLIRETPAGPSALAKAGAVELPRE